MILGFIIVSSVVQFCMYMLNDRYSVTWGNAMITLFFILANVFWFPDFFIPEYEENEVRCGMPAIAITVIFWILGNLFTVITYLIYKYGRRVIKKVDNLL